ncbi:MAG: folate-binding protein YgfZ [Actinobacteria bacterium]|nr:folate-binding protein YgfZ [Actinomycetota bacterium]
MTTSREQLETLRTDVGVVERCGRALVTVSGPDALSFLQGIVSQDLAPLGPGDSTHTLLLTPQGKLDTDIRLVRASDEEFWLDAEPGFGDRLVASLNRFRIRVKADVEDRSPQFRFLSVRGPRAEQFRPVARGVRGVHVVPAYAGFDVVGPADAVGAVIDAVREGGVPECGVDAYEALRIEEGVPRQGLDLDDKTIAQEAFLERDAVSFTKGCFLGQELVCRIDSRGHVNRFLRRLEMLDPHGAATRPPRGADIVNNGTPVGTVTSVSPVDDLPWLALGYVRREVEPPAEVTVRWDGGETRAVVRAAPATTAS